MSFLKNLFTQPKTEKSGIVFIIEDNAVYAQTLKAFLQSEFPELKEVKIFPVGETAEMSLHHNPDLIIVDYFLDTKYSDAETGLETVKKIRARKPEVNIIVLSAQENIDVVLQAVKTHNCSYVKKDADAFRRVAEITREAL
jgi:ActR/RegA family two-component response regulator